MTESIAEFAKITTIFGIAFFSLWGAIPAGIALGMDIVSVMMISAVSYVVGAGIILLLGDRVRMWFMRRFGSRIPQDPNSRIHRILDRYGAPGLGIIAPVTLGAQIGALLGIAVGLPARQLFIWMAVGGILWAIIFGILFALGIAGVQSAISSP